MANRQRITRQYEVTSALALTVRLTDARLRITGVDRPLATVNVSIDNFGGWHGVEDETVEQISTGIVFEGQHLSVESPPQAGPGWRRRSRLEYEIEVPRNTRLELTTSNGRVEVSNLRGPVRADVRNGPASLADLTEPVEIEVENGPLSVRRCASSLTAKVINGPVEAREVQGATNLNVVNGPADLRQLGSSVEAVAINGPVEYQGTIAGDLKLSARNGPIVLRLPAASRFELDAEANRGTVESDFEVDEGQPGPAGAHRLVLRTDRGNIRIQRDDGHRGARVVVGVGAWGRTGL
ncbi:MAG TPA: DUF4097 family beta strand repeat-containing protein [Dehalococcoidia bacterium]|nr:DUF4097 family beta strand repeat-containing protein [Dehalococcoidia bacterium]